MHSKIKVFVQKTLLAVSIGIAGVVAVVLAWRLRGLGLLLLGAYLLRLVLQKPVAAVGRFTRLPRGGAVAVTHLVFWGLLLGGGALLAPVLVRELLELTLEVDVSRFAPTLVDEAVIFRQNLLALQELFTGFSVSVSTLIGLLANTLQTLLATVLFLVVSFDLSLEPEPLYRRGGWLTSNRQHLSRLRAFERVLEHELTGWVVGRVSVMILVTLACFLGLSLLGVPYPLVLGIFTGILTIIPHLGLALAALPVILLAAITGGPLLIPIVAIFYVLLYQFDNLLVAPLLADVTTSVDPLLSILLIAAGWLLGGVTGILAAIPLYLIVRTGYSFWVKNLLK